MVFFHPFGSQLLDVMAEGTSITVHLFFLVNLTNNAFLKALIFETIRVM